MTRHGSSKERHVAQRRRQRRRKPAVLVWGSCAVAAVVLVLGASGTLSSWTSAVISNSTNTVATGKAVILRETNGTSTCNSSDSATNSWTCTTINKYGGTGTPLVPGGSATQTVTFSNVGAANGSTFQLAPGTCSQTPTAGSGSPAVANVCTNGDLTVAISCSDGATYSSVSPWSDLSYVAAAPPTATKTHAASSSDLNAGSSWTCQFTVALSATAGVTDEAVTVSQPLTWTLS